MALIGIISILVWSCVDLMKFFWYFRFLRKLFSLWLAFNAELSDMKLFCHSIVCLEKHVKVLPWPFVLVLRQFLPFLTAIQPFLTIFGLVYPFLTIALLLKTFRYSSIFYPPSRLSASNPFIPISTPHRKSTLIFHFLLEFWRFFSTENSN